MIRNETCLILFDLVFMAAGHPADLEDADSTYRLLDGTRKPGKIARKDRAPVSNTEPGQLSSFHHSCIHGILI